MWKFRDFCMNPKREENQGEIRKERKACDSENPLEIFCDILKLCAFSALALFPLIIRTKNKELSEKYHWNKYCTENDDFARTLRQKWKFLLFLLRCNVSLGRNEISGHYMNCIADQKTTTTLIYGIFTLHGNGTGTGTGTKWKVQHYVEILTLGPIVSYCARPVPLHRFCSRAVWVSHNTKTVDNVKSHSVGYGPFLKTDGLDTVYEGVQIDERKRYSHTQPYLAWKTGCYRRSI